MINSPVSIIIFSENPARVLLIASIACTRLGAKLLGVFIGRRKTHCHRPAAFYLCVWISVLCSLLVQGALQIKREKERKERKRERERTKETGE